MAYPEFKSFQPSLFVVENPQGIAIESDQRFTPLAELEKVAGSLGGVIELDPFANPQRTVPALHHITEEMDCFTTDWGQFLEHDRTVFGNPPYSNSAPFLAEMCRYIDSSAIHSAVTLTLAGVLSNKRTQGLIQKYAVAVCHPFGRINFMNSGNSNDRDVVYILWGKRASIELFRKHMTGLVSVLSI
jgi:hypothetical protein